MIKFSSSFKLNEIHVVDSAFNKDSKNIIFLQAGPDFGGGTVGNLGKMGNKQRHLLLCNRWVVNFKRKYQPLPLGTTVNSLLTDTSVRRTPP